MQALINYDDKLDLLMRLTNAEGPATLKKAITRSVTKLSDLALYVFPVFRWLGSDELCGMMCRPQLCSIAKNLLETPGLLSLLRQGYRDDAVGKSKLGSDGLEEEVCLAWFIHLCCVEFAEARRDTHDCYLMALCIIERKHVVSVCEDLAIVLGLDTEAKGGDSGELVTGAIVKLHSLFATPAHNGKIGVLVSRDASSQQWRVKLEADGHVLELSGDNLTPVRTRGKQHQPSVHAKTIEDLKAIAGGRHDNDLPNFRDVSVMPTVAEVRCTAQPYLPGPDTTSCSAHVERHFRLLREDLLGPARLELHLLQQGEGDHSRRRFSRVALESIEVNRGSGKKAMIVTSFELASGHKTLSMNAVRERIAYWETHSKGMLPAESLVLLIGPEGSEVFATVVHREAKDLAGGHKDDKRPRIGLQVEAAGCSGADAAGRFFRLVGRGPICEMVSITSSYSSYAPVLKVLQKKDKIPLSDVILNPAAYHPERPEYLRAVPNLESLFPQTLNPSQRSAMELAFATELALVQGPPGTGKTYIERAIIELIYRHTKEVILLEAYTNHALDQVLEGLLEKGITDFVRIGGRSKSTKLEPYNIRNLIDTRSNSASSGFKRRAAILYEKRQVAQAEAENLAEQVNMNSGNASWSVMSQYLRVKYKSIFKELNCEHHCGSGAHDEFQMVGKDGKNITRYYLWDLWRKGEKPQLAKNYSKILFKHAHSPHSIWTWNKQNRWDKIQEWIDDLTCDNRVSLAELLARMREIDEELRTLHKEPMYEILMDKRTRIIGVTSTGASQHADMLATVKPGVVIGEEAGELLEAHLLAGTHKNVKHMILIGDHKQLRPKIENYELSVVSGNGHDLNCSMFERLVRGGLQHSTLLEQHRMHPEIAAPIIELGIYPGLTNHPQTENRERIRGIAKRVCFIDHREPEHLQKALKAQTETSKSNLYEAHMCACICHYLIQQGYKGSDITVLTTYLGQVVEINKQLSTVMEMGVDINDRDIKDMTAGGIDIEVQGGEDQTGKGQKKGSSIGADSSSSTSGTSGKMDDRIRVSTVDNYQGEENKIIVISLVRSNAERQIGFLKEPERLTVLLSRAQCLEILIGNGDCLRNAKNARGAEWWDRLLAFLETRGQVVAGLPVKCASHDRCNMLRNPQDFEKLAPNGGCTLECTATLPCGHRCPLKCHAYDPAHTDVRCNVPVTFMCLKGHTVFGVCSAVADMASTAASSGKDITCKYCEVCNEIARIEKARENEIARIKAAMEKKRRQEDLQQAAEVKKIEEERARLQESREETERMRAKELRTIALEKIKRERELEESCRADELERLVREEEEQLEQELAEKECQIAMKNDALARKMMELQERRRKRQEEQDGREQEQNNRINDVWRRGEQSVRQAKRDKEVNVEELAPLLISIGDVLRQASEGKKKICDIQAILEGDMSDEAPARLELVAKCLGLQSAAELKPGSGAGQPNKVITSYLNDVNSGKCGWIEIHHRIEAKLDLKDPELELFHCFVTLQMLSGAQSTDELAKCQDCLSKYAGLGKTIKALKKNQTSHAVPLQNKVVPDMKNSIIYILLEVAMMDAESQGNPSLAAFRASVQLLLHPNVTLLSGIPDVCVKYLRKHVGVMIIDDKVGQINVDGTRSILSAVEKRRELRKKNAASSKALTELEDMVGLENIKNLMAEISARINLDRERGVDVKQQQMSMRFDGNPGTGKTTVARIYGDFLKEKGVLGTRSRFKETSGAKLVTDGVDKMKKMIEEEMKDGGVLFIDEAYQLNPKTNPMGGQILDYLLPEMENRRGTLVVVIAGYSKPMEDLMAFNEGLPSRFPERFVFEDYTEKELLQILKGLMLMGPGSWRLVDEKYFRIAARRLARQSGAVGFGNARAVRNLLDRAKKRQAARVLEERQQGHAPDIFLIERDDLLGPKNLDIRKCGELAKLSEMRGLYKVKQSVQELISLVEMNAELEDMEKKVRDVNLNKVFLGNPGTGKTTVAKLYGAILKAMGLLSKGDVIIKTPQDFTGEHLGQSEAKTKAILDNTKGCVLVIDEAYGLHAGTKMNDPYKTAVVDTIVAEIQGVPGDDRCVLLLGYQKEMEEMMRNTNAGLARRFNLQDAFHFDDYTDEDLLAILIEKVKALDMEIEVDTALKAIKILADQRRTELHFGNAGAVDNLLSSAKQRMMTRLKECTPLQMALTGNKLQVSDFSQLSNSGQDEANYSVDRILEDPSKFIDEIFANLIGCNSVKAQVKRFISTISFARKTGRDPLQNIELNFFFGGQPGTGKTTVARLMGRLLKALGLISKDNVTECSASDFVTGFVGQAGKQTREVFRRALGGVLFIDEAYRLNPKPLNGGTCMREVLDEIVQILTEKDFKNNMALIIAGYDDDMAMLFEVNPGLKSRIQTTLKFEQFTAQDSEECLRMKLRENELEVHPQHDGGRLLNLCKDLVLAPHWSNGRDIETLSKNIYQKHAEWIVGNRVTSISRVSIESGGVCDTMASAARKHSSFSPDFDLKSMEINALAYLPDDVVHFSVIEDAFRELICEKQRSSIEVLGGQNELQNYMQQLLQPQTVQCCEYSPGPVARSNEMLPQASEPLPELEKLTFAEDPNEREEISNHFEGVDKEFLFDIQQALEGLGVDVGNLEEVASFDIERLSAKFGRNFDLVKEWQRKIREVWEQAKRLEEDIVLKKRARRPKWRCALCGRATCRIAPYIEGYDDVEF